jgi:hypothetical protein
MFSATEKSPPATSSRPSTRGRRPNNRPICSVEGGTLARICADPLGRWRCADEPTEPLTHPAAPLTVTSEIGEPEDDLGEDHDPGDGDSHPATDS